MDVSKEYYPILEQCGMMRGIAPQCYGTVLFCLQARTIDYQRGVHVAEVGEATRCAGVLLRGGIEEFLYDENGNQITVAHIHEGQIFGAELACSGRRDQPRLPADVFGLHGDAAQFRRAAFRKLDGLSLPDAGDGQSDAGICEAGARLQHEGAHSGAEAPAGSA